MCSDGIQSPLCLAEAYQTARVINRDHKQPWLVAFELAKPVQLLHLTGRFPTQGGASMGLMTGPRSVSRRWAQGYYEVYGGPQGMIYPPSMNASEPAVALNDRAEAALLLPAVPTFHRALADPALLTVLRNAARTLGFCSVDTVGLEQCLQGRVGARSKLGMNAESVPGSASPAARQCGADRSDIQIWGEQLSLYEGAACIFLRLPAQSRPDLLARLPGFLA